MAYNRLKKYCALISCVLFAYPVSLSYSQSADMIRQQMLTRQRQQERPAAVDVPSITEGRTRLRSSDILPEEVPLLYPEQSEILLDGKIESSEYVVGPGDLMVIYFWGELDKSYLIRVTPEGYLIIPTVGSIMVSDKTLSDLREEVKTVVNRKYEGMEVSLFLKEPRRFRLYVSGIVYVPGMHESHTGERVSDLMDRAGLIMPGSEMDQETTTRQKQVYSSPGTDITRLSGESETEEEISALTVPKRAGIIGRTLAGSLGRSRKLGQVDLIEPEDLFTLGEKRGSSSRSIIIHRGDMEIVADMLHFIKLGDMDANPYVNSGDRIEVKPYHGDITIYGEVHDRGVYEFKDGDRVIDLVGFGGGLTSVADTSHARLVRFGEDGRSFNEITIDLYDALYKNPDDPEYFLRESDRLYVREKYDYKILSDVTILGEIKYPGQYAIDKNVTKLTDLIRMTGGFNGDENLEESRLIRKGSFATKDIEYERLKKLLLTERNRDENDYVRSYQRAVEGSINVDFVKLFKENDPTYDVVLQDGDFIYIPVKRDLVNVLGALKEPGYVRVKEGANINYYIEKAGGYNYDANKKFTRIFKARTNQWYRYSKLKVPIEGGDTIHVPEKFVGIFWTWSTFWQYSSYLTQFATLYFIIVSISK